MKTITDGTVQFVVTKSGGGTPGSDFGIFWDI